MTRPSVVCPECRGAGHEPIEHTGRCRQRREADCDCAVRCETCDGTGDVRDPDTYCAGCAAESSPDEAPALVNGICPECEDERADGGAA